MGSNGFSSHFPAGLRVLVVDADHVWLKNLEKMLNKCNYEVRTSNLGKEAIDMLEEENERIKFDIVISEVNMSDMDCFKFLQHVALKLDIPVIMMSGDEETSKVMKGVQCGACDYLVKPIGIKDVRHIWQHVFRKRMLQQIVGGEDSPVSEIGEAGKKRKRLVDEGVGDSSKKPRVIWTEELHHKFLKAVAQIGNNKFGPKKILELMGDTSLTRENVASHLQKHRLNLSRDKKTASAHEDIYPQQPAGVMHPANNIQRSINLNFQNLQLQFDPKIGHPMYQPFDLQNSLLQSELKMQLHHHYTGNNDAAELLPYTMRSTKNEHNASPPDFNNHKHNPPKIFYDYDGQFQH